MLPYIILVGVAAGCLHLGAKGLFEGKVQFSSAKTITGTPARVIGAICSLVGIVFGILLFFMMATAK